VTPHFSLSDEQRAQLERYAGGEASPDDVVAAEVLLAAHPWLATAISTIKGPRSYPNRVSADHGLSELREAMAVPAERSAEKRLGTRGGILRTTGSVVSIVSAAIVVIAAWMIASRPEPLSRDASTYVTDRKMRSAITLSDGTRMILAPMTKVTVPADFGRTTRTVTLAGEAHFDVQGSVQHPFIVRTNGTTTRVLGTSFSVRRYEHETVTRVAVHTGKVESRGRRAALLVSAGMMGIVNDSVARLVSPRVGSQSYTDWENGRLVFNRTPVPEMLKTLGRWYGYEFRLTDSTLASQSVSAVFKVTDAAEMMLVLKGTLGVSLTVDENVVVLKPRKHGVRRSPDKSLLTPILEMGR
jgi:transmembrane sensor